MIYITSLFHSPLFTLQMQFNISADNILIKIWYKCND